MIQVLDCLKYNYNTLSTGNKIFRMCRHWNYSCYFHQFGCTALHYASRQGNAEIVKILMENGANVDIERAVNFYNN